MSLRGTQAPRCRPNSPRCVWTACLLNCHHLCSSASEKQRGRSTSELGWGKPGTSQRRAILFKSQTARSRLRGRKMASPLRPLQAPSAPASPGWGSGSPSPQPLPRCPRPCRLGGDRRTEESRHGCLFIYLKHFRSPKKWITSLLNTLG